MANDELQADKSELQDILSKAEYTVYSSGNGGNSLLAWLKRMWQRLLDLLPDWGVPQAAANTVAYIGIGVILAALGGFIVWLVRSMIVKRGGQRSGLFGHIDELELSSARLQEEAGLLAAQGDYPEAVRRMFLTLLLLLNEREWIRVERWKTNREYWEELAERQPAAVADFTQAARLFEHVYYGRGIAGHREYVQMREYGVPYVGKGDGA